MNDLILSLLWIIIIVSTLTMFSLIYHYFYHNSLTLVFKIIIDFLIITLELLIVFKKQTITKFHLFFIIYLLLNFIERVLNYSDLLTKCKENLIVFCSNVFKCISLISLFFAVYFLIIENESFNNINLILLILIIPSLVIALLILKLINTLNLNYKSLLIYIYVTALVFNLSVCFFAMLNVVKLFLLFISIIFISVYRILFLISIKKANKLLNVISEIMYYISNFALIYFSMLVIFLI